ncbi:hypothetical protein V2I52_09645 [Brenneria sp. g21c3]|uniref:hypothetical protein n=1 Tax=Brenneria sp. g21c3 TaxID=3093893 RepID=UPI002E9F7A3E|nr:hypothetical protein [Brenneria sp. g21c3]
MMGRNGRKRGEQKAGEKGCFLYPGRRGLPDNLGCSSMLSPYHRLGEHVFNDWRVKPVFLATPNIGRYVGDRGHAT